MIPERPLIAFGPEAPGWGSWDWVGSDICCEVSKYFRTIVYKPRELPVCDVLLMIKHPLPLEMLEQVPLKTPVIYVPVDYYGSAAEIDQDSRRLRKCHRIIVHCERLRRYFEPYSSTDSMDHHVKFAPPLRKSYRAKGFFLWVGVRSNLVPLVEWVNEHPLQGELYVLTNPDNPETALEAADLGFRPDSPIRIQTWNKERHLALTAQARAAIDVKGNDFRSRHKPAAKAIDFIASGLPLAMNPDSCVVDHLARMGFDIPSPLDTSSWLSMEFWRETVTFGKALREVLSLARIGRRYKRIIDDVLAERRSI
jgi:hypothetical protein